MKKLLVLLGGGIVVVVLLVFMLHGNNHSSKHSKAAQCWAHIDKVGATANPVNLRHCPTSGMKLLGDRWVNPKTNLPIAG